MNPVYTYDANGNMLAGAGRALTYKSFNKVATITANGQTTSFTYDDGHGRIKKVTDDETVIYLGMTEKRISSTGDVKWYDYVEADGRRVALRVFDQTTLTTDWRYYIHDHLGSAVVELDETGSVTERMSYDAWGKRRAPETAEFYAAGFVPVLTNNRGFTGHEHLDDVGLINMNARLYDPELGRFLQADTVTESLTYSQVFNRYTYVGNNPLSHTDPTGHSWLSSLFRKVPILRAIFQIAVAIVASWALGPAGFGLFAKGSAALAAASGFIAGGVAGGSLKSAVIGGLTAFAFAKIGDFKGLTKPGTDGELTTFAEVIGSRPGSAIAHGMVGGIASEAQGGKFSSGFLSAGFSDLAGSYINFEGENVVAKQTVAHAVIGGTVSKAMGGKFANGAATSAFGYLFNELVHNRKNRGGAPITEGQQASLDEGDYVGFWKSRYHDSGDPVARTALVGWGHGREVGADILDIALAKISWRMLKGRLKKIGYVNVDQTMRDIGLDLARRHADYVTNDNYNIPHLLSPTQVAHYHHESFLSFGVRSGYFGGTMPFGVGQNISRSLWCSGCDISPM